ncbi:uncharacterized protein LOC129237512 isoform X1 [Anastrepha obliqua]|uniref:uncharacterized protein LOC129237512 isoform X1 n=1 Tax=Anastrepha obliqua TaxID=95512 RepID=UPI0024092B99|nr:uncharacterized protein LOC129237512 isoform X1 [Anastrepha obliqua]
MEEMEDDNDIPSSSHGKYISTAEIKSMWNLMKISANLGTPEQCVKFAEDTGLILRSKLCSTHRIPMSHNIRGNSILGTFRCRERSCRNKSGFSRAKGTWFENSRLSLPLIFYLMYCYAHNWPHASVRLENFVGDSVLSSETITDWYNYCREAVVCYQIDKQEAIGKIGGPGKKVQIDEIKFAKRDQNKGGKVEGHWLLGIIEDGSEDLRLESCHDDVRSVQVILPLIKKHVEEGTTIRTDFWESCDSLVNSGYQYQKVDSDKHQRIDSQWRVVKRFYYRNYIKNSTNFADMIVEFLWRKSISRKHGDPFVKLIEAIKYSFKP